ncbi:MAG: hypothetical protein M1832_005713 [Thelocarpon impressellum]|nr:MAG: hypothetical protein M1832_005713 [Thelocarpon impressellum]
MLVFSSTSSQGAAATLLLLPSLLLLLLVNHADAHALPAESEQPQLPQPRHRDHLPSRTESPAALHSVLFTYIQNVTGGFTGDCSSGKYLDNYAVPTPQERSDVLAALADHHVYSGANITSAFTLRTQRGNASAAYDTCRECFREAFSEDAHFAYCRTDAVETGLNLNRSGR